MNTPNTHFTDYRVLEADTAEELSEAVMQAIHNRWQPYGDMTVTKTHHGAEQRVMLFQPIVQQAEWFR